jgi:hypothetical protein
MVKKGFFVRVTEPNEVRKNLLEGSKSIIQNLKSYQKILAIREKKLSAMNNLKTDVKEIKLLVDKLRDLLPYEIMTELEKDKPKKKKGKKTTKNKNVKEKVAPKKKVVKPSEATRLESALSSIEEKLNRLS